MACDHQHQHRHRRRNNNILCLITGSSGSGKSSIAEKLKEQLPKKDTHDVVKLFHQDHYFTKPFLPYNKRIDDSYENDSGIDWSRLIQDIIKEIISCVTTTTTTTSTIGSSSSSSLNTRNNHDSTSISSANNKSKTNLIIIVEGHLLGAATNKFLDFATSYNITTIISVLIYCSRESCKHRRLTRRKNRNEFEMNELSKYFDQYVWPSYLKYGIDAMELLRNNNDLTITKVSNNNSDDDDRQKKKKKLVIEIDTDSMSLNESVDTIVTKMKEK